MKLFEVVKPGLMTTIQDHGRFGYRANGVPISGPMDRYAYTILNELLGNKPSSAVLEVWHGGLELICLCDCDIAITGSKLNILIDGSIHDMWKVIRVNAGQMVKLEQATKGVIAYLGIRGVLEVETWLGSASIYSKGGMGRPLIKGDTLEGTPIRGSIQGLIQMQRPLYSQQLIVKIWPSVHRSLFKNENIQGPYRLKAGDRMGYLFEGPPIEFYSSSDILSEAVEPGTIQVNNKGQLIVLMADAQTTGGYATLGKIVDADLWKVAQLRPGGELQLIDRQK
jgi:biotin-dependent carboxylase-like uncharacterized protein